MLSQKYTCIINVSESGAKAKVDLQNQRPPKCGNAIKLILLGPLLNDF